MSSKRNIKLILCQANRNIKLFLADKSHDCNLGCFSTSPPGTIGGQNGFRIVKFVPILETTISISEIYNLQWIYISLCK